MICMIFPLDIIWMYDYDTPYKIDIFAISGRIFTKVA